jgi:hypothetical protein
MKTCDGLAYASSADVDNDGETEIVLKNGSLFAVITPRWGGRLVALYSIAGERGAMVVGNPCDDWNWMEELNRYMDVPRNHPGAFADVGFEHEEYTFELIEDGGVRLRAKNGIEKEFQLDGHVLRVRYSVPDTIEHLSTECGLSPDYLRLLRSGSECLQGYDNGEARGWRTDHVAVWVKPDGAVWEEPFSSRFGHGCVLRCGSDARQFSIELGVTTGLAVHADTGAVQLALV